MKLSLASRIFLGYAVVLATFGAVSIFSVSEMHRNQREIRLLSQGYLQLSQDAAALETFQKNREKDSERILQEPNHETRRALIRLSRLYFPALLSERLDVGRRRAKEVQSFAPDSEEPFLRELVHRLDVLANKLKTFEEVALQMYEVLATASPDADTLAKKSAGLKQVESAIGSDIRFLRLSLDNRIRERVDQAELRERRTGLFIIGLSVLAIGIGLVATLMAARTLRPIRHLTSFVSRIGKGDYSAQLGLTGDDEISVLAQEFDQLAKSLREREAQLREKQEALFQAQQLAAVGRISAQVAHEVRNPLSSIGLNVELLQEALGKAKFHSVAEAKDALSQLSTILREVDRLTEITEQYLGMARMPLPHLAQEDINGVLGDVLNFSREELERGGVQVVQKLSAEGARALADENQLRQVFLNLVRNSREAMSDYGGTLTVESRLSNGHVEVRLSDTGRGMENAIREHIFEPFFTTKQGGTGLGLAVSRQIIQAHGGSIECHSAPGQGCHFTIRIPRAQGSS